MGHAGSRAAMVYQHATSEQNALIAARLDALVEAARKSPPSTDVNTG